MKKLYRTRTDRMIWGVCGGLAEYFNVDPTIVRVAAVLSIFISGLGILAYIILAIVVPLESSSAARPEQVIRENVEEIKATTAGFGEGIRSAFAGKEGRKVPSESPGRSLTVIGVIIVLLGILFLLDTFSIVWWLRWRFLWPLVLVAIGLLILFRRRRR